MMAEGTTKVKRESVLAVRLTGSGRQRAEVLTGTNFRMRMTTRRSLASERGPRVEADGNHRRCGSGGRL